MSAGAVGGEHAATEMGHVRLCGASFHARGQDHVSSETNCLSHLEQQLDVANGNNSPDGLLWMIFHALVNPSPGYSGFERDGSYTSFAMSK